MNENELLFHISRIARASANFGRAVERIGVLLEEELGGNGLVVTENSSITSGIAPVAEQFFLETAHLPIRSFYSVALRANGQELGRLIAFFASASAEQGLAQRVATFAGEQLGMMLERIRLAERRKQLKAEIATIRVNLATRKAVHRAQGILARRGMDPETARRWLRREAVKSGRSLIQTANELFESEVRAIAEPSPEEVPISA